MRSAFLSVSDKTGLVRLANSLLAKEYRLVATDGTHAELRRHGLPCDPLSSLTGWPEMLGGRVKSLHPALFGGLLADRHRPEHVQDMERHFLADFRVLAVNLYPFREAVAQQGNGAPLSADEAVTLMDVGGVAAVRAAAKNFRHVTVLSHPEQYVLLDAALESEEERRKLALAAFRLTSQYDAAIADYLDGSSPHKHQRQYYSVSELKYGCNPHQRPAALLCKEGRPASMRLLNGNWGYINILDAVNAWGLVTELEQHMGRPAAASFKHTQPAGCAVARDWNDLPTDSQTLLKATFGIDASSPPSVNAYARARNADPLSSFGDFIGFSGIVDKALADFVNSQISDGIVAHGYTPEALEVLKGKKKGAYVVIASEKVPPTDEMELRDVGGGLTLAQAPNNAKIDRQALLKSVPTARKELSDDAVENLILANACLKFAQSNSVAAASQGQVIAVASGQQSRIDAVRLVADKANCWTHRHTSEAVNEFAQSKGAKQDRIVASVARARAASLKSSAALKSSDVVLASDGFFPFADGIDEAMAIQGLKYVSQPGGSLRDEDVVKACDKYGLTMSMTGIRIFSH